MNKPKSQQSPGFLKNPGTEFDFYLAEKLGMLVADLRKNMSGLEWLEWLMHVQLQEQREELETKKARAKKG